jgi:hypothetical protein
VTTKQQVIDLNKKHPTWTAREIADELGCMVEYVASCKTRYGLNFAPARNRTMDPNNIYALGREARRAGLTVEAIQKIAGHRRASA